MITQLIECTKTAIENTRIKQVDHNALHVHTHIYTHQHVYYMVNIQLLATHKNKHIPDLPK